MDMVVMTSSTEADLRNDDILVEILHYISIDFYRK